MDTPALRCTRHVTLAALLIVAPSWPNSIESQTATAASAAPTGAQQAKTMKIRIDVDGIRLTATLDDTVASKNFRLTSSTHADARGLHRTEKISELPKKLSTQDAPAGVDPSRGDIAYYAPWGNLAIFYKDFPYSRGLVRLGRLDSGVEMFEQSRALEVTVRQVDA